HIGAEESGVAQARVLLEERAEVARDPFTLLAMRVDDGAAGIRAARTTRVRAAGEATGGAGVLPSAGARCRGCCTIVRRLPRATSVRRRVTLGGTRWLPARAASPHRVAKSRPAPGITIVSGVAAVRAGSPGPDRA